MSDTKKQPNILFVFADQLRASSVGYAGEEQVKTPHIDEFARKNSYFKTAVSMMPVCGPYRACLVTGRTPTATGQIINDIPLQQDEISIGRVYKQANYDTAYVGKWHLNGPNRPGPVLPSQRHGWDYWMGANFEHNYSRSRFTDNDGNEKTWKGFDAESQTDDVIDYLKNRNSENPFCMFLSWGPPITPIVKRLRTIWTGTIQRPFKVAQIVLMFRATTFGDIMHKPRFSMISLRGY